jgi:protein ImuB
MRRVVFVWLPAWAIERLERTQPGAVPAEHPFALVEKGPRGLVVSAVNACARALGVQEGETLADVRTRLPSLAARPAMAARDADALHALARWLGRYGPTRNVDGRDGIWIDVTGVAHLFGGEEALLADLVARLARLGLTAQAGVAETHRAAAALARFSAAHMHPYFVSTPGNARADLGALPITALDLDAATAALLRRLGLKRIDQLYGLPRAALAQRFRRGLPSTRAATAGAAAATVLVRLDQALGVLADPRRPLEEPPDADVRLPCPEPLMTAGGIEAALRVLADTLVANLAAAVMGARRFQVALYRTDGTCARAAVATSAPCRQPEHICRLFADKLAALDAGFGVDLVVLCAADLQALTDVQTTFDDSAADAAGRSVAHLIDRLASRLGSDRVYCVTPVASHIPERAQRAAPAIAARTPSLPPADQPRRGARPALLLDPPEPITVVAEVPEGAPLRLQWRRVRRRIVRTEGPERIAPEWWRACALAPQHRPRTRDYYRLEDDTGAGFWVFREGLFDDEQEEASQPPRWFLHGLFA